MVYLINFKVNAMKLILVQSLVYVRTQKEVITASAFLVTKEPLVMTSTSVLSIQFVLKTLHVPIQIRFSLIIYCKIGLSLLSSLN